MISNMNLIILTIFMIFTFVYGGCWDGSSKEDCACTTNTTGAIGFCNCSKISVRQGQQCAYDSLNGVDSVRYFLPTLSQSVIFRELSFLFNAIFVGSPRISVKRASVPPLFRFFDF
jgi:hypothetical protein